jgi:hypothetical protein
VLGCTADKCSWGRLAARHPPKHPPWAKVYTAQGLHATLRSSGDATVLLSSFQNQEIMVNRGSIKAYYVKVRRDDDDYEEEDVGGGWG